MICPCKDCEKKGCGAYHSQCKEYIEFTEWKKQTNANERQAKQFNYKSNERSRKWNKKN